MGKNKNPVTGYHYSFGIHMGLSRGPINELIEIRVGDKVAWQGVQSTSGTFNINKPELFGGEKQEGGIVGPFNMLMGEEDQKAPSALVAMLNHALPGFRRMATAFFNGRIATNSPYPKAWAFRVRRTTKGWEGGQCWYPEKATIVLSSIPGESFPDDDEAATARIPDEPPEEEPPGEHYEPNTRIVAMNPAHIIYECLTNRAWGRGLPASALDSAAFAAVADTLHEEKFGLCLRWSRTDSLESFLQSILDHISGVVYSDRKTALLTLKLIRDDYVVEELPIYDTDSGLLGIDELAVSALGPAVNEIRVEFNDPTAKHTRTVNAQNLASLQATNGVFNSIKKSYPGIPTSELALRLAQRDLRANATSLRRFKLTFDRRAWRIPPAGVLRIRDLQRGIVDIVVRVGRIENGTLTNGQITITAVQDVFALPKTSFIGVEPPKWVKPDTTPAIKRHRVFEVPYFLLAGNLSPADFAQLHPESGFIGSVVEKPTPLSIGYELAIKPGAPTQDEIPKPKP